MTTNHDSIRNNLLEPFIAKQDEYPVDRSGVIAILNKYDEKKPMVQVASEGTAFAQKGKKSNAKKNDEKAGEKKEGEESKTYFADKECFICGKKGHEAKKCPQQARRMRLMICPFPASQAHPPSKVSRISRRRSINNLLN